MTKQSWIILNWKLMNETTPEEKNENEIYAVEAQYYLIDEKRCIICIDEIMWILLTSNDGTQINSSDEISQEFAKHLIGIN